MFGDFEGKQEFVLWFNGLLKYLHLIYLPDQAIETQSLLVKSTEYVLELKKIFSVT